MADVIGGTVVEDDDIEIATLDGMIGFGIVDEEIDVAVVMAESTVGKEIEILSGTEERAVVVDEEMEVVMVDGMNG